MPSIRAIVTAIAFIGIGLAANRAWAQSPSFTPPSELKRTPSAPTASEAFPTAPAPTASTPAAGLIPAVAADRGRTLGAGDLVSFQILEDKDPPVTKRVTDTGELDIPYIGRVQASGRSCDQVAADIKRRLEADYYFKVTVKLGLDLVNRVAPSIGKVYLSGYVRAPGPLDLMPGEKATASTVIVKAGGATQFGDLRKVKVTRKKKGGESETVVVDVKSVIEKGDLGKDYEVRDGDYLYVPQKLINW